MMANLFRRGISVYKNSSKFHICENIFKEYLWWNALFHIGLTTASNNFFIGS